MLAPSLQQFSLRTEMLPSYIPVRVAEKILFVGESVQMFENHTQNPPRAGERASCHTCTLTRDFDLFHLPCNIASDHSFRLHPEAPGGHVCCRTSPTETAATLQSGRL